MFRGTTPPINFNIYSDVDFNEIEQVWITFKGSYESGKEVTYTKDDLTFNADQKQIALTLTQEQTLYFDAGKLAVQMRILMKNGDAWASEIKGITVEAILKDGVIE